MDSIKRGDTVTKGSHTGTVIAASEGGVVVRWDGDITLEKAADLALTTAPPRVGLAPELRAELDAWQVPE